MINDIPSQYSTNLNKVIAFHTKNPDYINVKISHLPDWFYFDRFGYNGWSEYGLKKPDFGSIKKDYARQRFSDIQKYVIGNRLTKLPQSKEPFFCNYDFFFVHVKYTDSRGEDGDFDAKVKVIEEVDSLLPILTDLRLDVMAITADHSTPAVLKAHSWHPVPVLVHGKYARIDEVRAFHEIACITGTLGRQPMINLMPIVLANALRLQKYGA